MSITDDLAALFQRDLTRLLQQVLAFKDLDILWVCPPGISNSAGNLILHLEGNQREYIGRILGGIPYHRVRDDEFSLKGVSVAELVPRIEEIGRMVPSVIRGLSEEQLNAVFPGHAPQSTSSFLIHLHGHLNYHLGQIDYLRRISSRGAAVEYAGL